MTGQRLTMLYCGSPEVQDVAGRVVEMVGFVPVYCGQIRPVALGAGGGGGGVQVPACFGFAGGGGGGAQGTAGR